MVGDIHLSRERFQKGILIFFFSCLIIALILTWMTPATGFESSIYASTPLVLWIVLIAGEFVGISLIVLSLSRPDYGRWNLWKFGLLFIILCYAIIVNLFIIRGYFAWCLLGDPASHIGWTNEVLDSGHLRSYLIYPALHIFTSEISLLTRLSPLSLHKIIPVFFPLLSVGFTYLFVRTMTSNPVIPIIACVITTFPIIFSHYTNFAPNSLADMYILLAFFLIFKYLQEDKGGWGILLFITLILFPVFHPLPSIVIMVFLITLWIPHAFRDVWSGFRESNYNFLSLIQRNINKKFMIPFLILSIWFVFWYSSFALWGNTLANMFYTISSEGGGPSSLTHLTSQANYAQSYGFNVVDIALKQYGGTFLIGILSVFTFPLLWGMTSREQKKENIFSLYGPWIVFCGIIPLFYIFNLTFGPLRFVSYITIWGTIFVASLVSYLIIRCRDIPSRVISWSISIIVIILLFSLFLSGGISIYPSPIIYSQTYHSTYSDVLGMTHFFEYRNASVTPIGPTTILFRYVHLLIPQEQRARQKIPDYDTSQERPLWHFGYDSYPSIASPYDTDRDLIIEKRSVLHYQDVFPEMAKFRYLPEDFIRLKNDPGANLVYSSGEFDLLTIKGKNQTQGFPG